MELLSNIEHPYDDDDCTDGDPSGGGVDRLGDEEGRDTEEDAEPLGSEGVDEAADERCGADSCYSNESEESDLEAEGEMSVSGWRRRGRDERVVAVDSSQ